MKINSGMVAGFLGIAFSALVWVASGTFPVFELKGAGPEFYPRVMAGLLALLSLILLYQGFRLGDASEKPEPLIKKKFYQLMATFGLILFYYFTMEILGYFTSTFLVCTAVSLVLFGKLDKKVVAYALANSSLICGAIYVVFRILLKASLPSGIFF